MDLVGKKLLPPNLLKALFFTALATALLLPMAMVRAATDTVEVNVSIEGVSEITVIPTSLNFSQSPGTAAPFTKIDVQNTGSLNISNIHVFTDTIGDENVRPYGITNSQYYAAGGVLVIRNQTLSTNYFAGRLEWNATADISNMVKTGVNSPVAWGFYRNTSFEYNFLVGNGTGTTATNILCNQTGSQFGISDIADNGTSATRTPDASTITYDAGDTGYGYFSVDRSTSVLNTACVAVAADCSKIYIYKYDKRAGFTGCGNSEYLQGPNLLPGQVHTFNMSAYIPLGIPSTPGQLNTSTVTVSAT